MLRLGESRERGLKLLDYERPGMPRLERAEDSFRFSERGGRAAVEFTQPRKRNTAQSRELPPCGGATAHDAARGVCDGIPIGPRVAHDSRGGPECRCISDERR